MAILDTGIDLSHPQLQAARRMNKIKDCQGFPTTLNPLCDPDGHGTHGASVLMMTAPNATIYIARIADNKGLIVPDDNYDAIVMVFTGLNMF